MKYAVEIFSYVMIYIPSFVEISLGIQKVLGWTHIETYREQVTS
jgi:hypothetical protein